jgi:hypothetical protein
MPNPFAVIGIILLLAFLVESLTEYLFGKLFENVPALKPFSWLLMYIAAGIGVAGAFYYRFDLVSLVSQYLSPDAPIVAGWFGITLTGLGIGRGANYISDIVERFFIKSKP